MAELTFKSAGVSTREIDLSGPTPQTPQGVPAGVIGTSNEGPAFVPLTFATFSEFVSLFGQTDGVKFGPLAVNEWLKNAKACTYIRVLGIGDGKKRVSDGSVNRSGFTVGDQIVQDNGILGQNLFANHVAGTAAIKGRTYFLGAFMSESNGSTIFSDAGIQAQSARATATIEFGLADGSADLALLADGDKLTIKDTQNKSVVFTFKDDTASAAAPEVSVQMGSGVDVSTKNGQFLATKLKAAIDGLTDFNVSVVRNDNVLTLTQESIGPIGNTTIVPDVASAQNNITASNFTGGAGGAVPILRGVLMAPSGVILHLSESRNNSTAPVFTETATTDGIVGRKGALTGSVDLASQEFVMLMNGFKGSVAKPSIVTASFDMTSPSYFANVFNTDPLRIEEEGHLLYGSYDIYPSLTRVTGSGVVYAGHISSGSTNSTKEDISFLLTSSLGRGASLDGTYVPDYEDFKDRFTHAESPFVISQGFDTAAGYDLFKLVALSAGEAGSLKFKLSIENLVPQKTGYGTFDLVVRKFRDTDDERQVLESHRGLSLDPGSDRYIGRAIGDQHTFYNFDNDAESQKIVVDGTHPVRSRYVRVQLSDHLKQSEVPEEALPVGFRGPRHLVTSGSMLGHGYADPHVFGRADELRNIVEPPFPMKQSVAVGVGLNKRVDTRLYWGMDSSIQESAANPNKTAPFNNSLLTYAKHFPNHRIDTTGFAVGNNLGTQDRNGSVLDCDRFNNSRFSLEKIKVRLGSNNRADPDQWLSASYVRNGNISSVTDGAGVTTRAFKLSDLDTVSNRKFSKFTLPLQGGFDGTNIFNLDQKNLTNSAAKREIDDATQGETSGPTISAYRKAVDIMGSKADAEIQLLAIPGLRHTSVTDYAISAVESRFDALYIMDIEERDKVNTIITSSVQTPHVLNTVNTFTNRALDSSFAAAYFPDLTVVDPGTGAFVKTPPSVAVLGAYSNNDKIGHPWTAPAGFARGGLSGVEMSSVLLNRTNLDDLYDADINPITAFPGTGITVWGQKTLLQNASALDRVNVRRLLINVRRTVRNIANTLLFEPNRSETLEKFSALVNPVLQRIQEQSGIDRYKVIIDSSTTTQADVENNTLRGKIFLQPTRAVEFVALDFVVTNAGSDLL